MDVVDDTGMVGRDKVVWLTTYALVKLNADENLSNLATDSDSKENFKVI